MDTYNKVVWSEGMFLRPQHFQQQERYLELMRHQRAQAPAHYFWGFRRLQLDATSLALGIVAILDAEGIFPDGTPFSFSIILPGNRLLLYLAGISIAVVIAISNH